MKKILCFSPHPDDIEIFMGATLKEHLDRGDLVSICLVTNGGSGTMIPWKKGAGIADIRKKELDLSLKEFGDLSLIKLNIPDGKVKNFVNASKLIDSVIKNHLPDIIYTPEYDKNISLYRHPDHLATGQMVVSTIKKLTINAKIRFYHSTESNFTLNVKKDGLTSKALSHHKSQYLWSANPPFLLHWFPRFINRRQKDNVETFRSESFDFNK